MKIVLDTSGLIDMIKFKCSPELFIDLVEEKVEFVVLKPVIRELEGISRNKGKKGSEAKAALMLLKAIKPDIVEMNINADKAILKFAIQTNASVLTSDKRLKNELKRHGITVFTVKRKNYIEKD